MARRILAIDWDGVEARFALGTVQKDRLIVLKAGSAPIVDDSEVAASAGNETAADDDAEEYASGADFNDDAEENGGESSAPIRTPSPKDDAVAENEAAADDGAIVVERAGSSAIPSRVFYGDEDEEDEDASGAGIVVSRGKKSKKGESFKTSPLARTLKKLLRENRVGNASISYLVERGDVDVLYATIPQASDAETPEIVLNVALRESLTFNETQPLDYFPFGSTAGRRSGTRRVAAVSIARDKMRRIRETLLGATRAPSRIGMREPTLAEFVRLGFDGLKFGEPVVLVQSLCEEVNLTLCDGETVLYFRSFKIAADADDAARAARICDEIVRTIAVGSDETPEDVIISKAVLFDAAPKKSAKPDESENSDDEEAQDAEIVDDAEPTLADFLAAKLEEEGIALELANPFRLGGVRMKTQEPENPGRFAALLGAILAERPQTRPAIDLLHPREKPKAPNYLAASFAYLLVVGVAFGGVWYWNKNDLKRINAEIAEIELERNEVAANLNSKTPLYNVLSGANHWQNGSGVIVLDELRDIAYRIPKAPELVVTRLAYMGSQNGRSTFVISAKISSIEVYQQFRASLMGDRSHTVTSQRGPVPNPGGGGYTHLFEANIICQRRPAQTFVAKLPQELQAISNNAPEQFVERERERQEEMKRLQEEAQKKAAAEREAQQKRLEEARKAQEEAKKAQEEAARKAQEEAKKAQEEAARKAQEEAQKAQEAAANAQTPQAGETAANGENAQSPQNGETAQNPEDPAALSDALKKRLLERRAWLDGKLKEAQTALQQGKTTQAQFAQVQAQYRQNVAPVVQIWNFLGNCDAQMKAAQAKFDKGEIPAEQLEKTKADYKRCVAQAAQNCDKVCPQNAQTPQNGENAQNQPAGETAPAAENPTPETPAPQPEAPAPEPAPQPEAPAPEPAPQPEAPAPEPAPQPEAPAPAENPAPAPQPEAPVPEPAPQPEAPAPTAASQRPQTDQTEA